MKKKNLNESLSRILVSSNRISTMFNNFTNYSGHQVMIMINETDIEEDDDQFSIDDFELASKDLQFCLTVLYSVTAGLALFGNVLSIIVLMKGKRSSRDLRLFLVNLSMSDILMSIFSIPFTYTDFIMGRWIFHPQLCPIVQSIQIVSVFVSIYTLVTIGIDRYIAIMKPFMVNFWNKSFAPIIVSLTWLTGGILGIIICFYSYAEPFKINNIIYYDCRETWQSKEQEQIYTIGLFLIVFALPLLCLIFFYGSICYKLWYHSMPGNANIARDNAQWIAKRKVIKMLITIVALFAICWFPSHLFHLIRVFHEDWLLKFSGNDASNPSYLAVVIISHWLSMAHSFVNPIIYSFMSDNFKADVKYMVHRMIYFRYHRRRHVHNHNQQRIRNPDEDDDDDDDNDDGADRIGKEGKEILAAVAATTNHHRNLNPEPEFSDKKIELLILKQQKNSSQQRNFSKESSNNNKSSSKGSKENSKEKSIFRRQTKSEQEEEEQQRQTITSFIITNNSIFQ